MGDSIYKGKNQYLRRIDVYQKDKPLKTHLFQNENVGNKKPHLLYRANDDAKEIPITNHFEKAKGG